MWFFNYKVSHRRSNVCGSLQVVAYLIPERNSIRSVGRIFDHSRELLLRYTWDELGESETFIIRKIGQRLDIDIDNDELSQIVR